MAQRQVVRGVVLPPGVTLKSEAGGVHSSVDGTGSSSLGKINGGSSVAPETGTLPVSCRFYAHLPSQSGITMMSASGVDQHLRLHEQKGGFAGSGESHSAGIDNEHMDGGLNAEGGSEDLFNWAGISKVKVLAVHPSCESGERSSWVATCDEAQNIVVWNHASRSIALSIDPATLEARRHSGESHERCLSSRQTPVFSKDILVPAVDTHSSDSSSRGFGLRSLHLKTLQVPTYMSRQSPSQSETSTESVDGNIGRRDGSEYRGDGIGSLNDGHSDGSSFTSHPRSFDSISSVSSAAARFDYGTAQQTSGPPPKFSAAVSAAGATTTKAIPNPSSSTGAGASASPVGRSRRSAATAEALKAVEQHVGRVGTTGNVRFLSFWDRHLPSPPGVTSRGNHEVIARRKDSKSSRGMEMVQMSYMPPRPFLIVACDSRIFLLDYRTALSSPTSDNQVFPDKTALMIATGSGAYPVGAYMETVSDPRLYVRTLWSEKDLCGKSPTCACVPLPGCAGTSGGDSASSGSLLCIGCSDGCVRVWNCDERVWRQETELARTPDEDRTGLELEDDLRGGHLHREDVPVVSIHVLAAEKIRKATSAGWRIRLFILCANGEATVWHLSGGTATGKEDRLRGTRSKQEVGFDPNRRIVEEATRLARFSVPKCLLQHRTVKGIGALGSDATGDPELNPEELSNALKFRLDGWWVDACSRRMGAWSGSEIAIFDLSQNATGMIILQAAFSTELDKDGKDRGDHRASITLSPRMRSGTDTTVKSLTHRHGLSSGYTHIVGINNGNGGGHPSLPATALLACGKGPFLDLLTVDGLGGGHEVRVAHSWDLRRVREALPDKLKIYALQIHPHLCALVLCATNIGIFVVDLVSGGMGNAVSSMGICRSPVASHPSWTGSLYGVRALRLTIGDMGDIMLQPCCLQCEPDSSKIQKVSVLELGPPFRVPELIRTASSHRHTSWLTSNVRLIPSVSGELLCVLWPIARQYIIIATPPKLMHGESAYFLNEDMEGEKNNDNPKQKAKEDEGNITIIDRGYALDFAWAPAIKYSAMERVREEPTSEEAPPTGENYAEEHVERFAVLQPGTMVPIPHTISSGKTKFTYEESSPEVVFREAFCSTKSATIQEKEVISAKREKKRWDCRDAYTKIVLPSSKLQSSNQATQLTNILETPHVVGRLFGGGPLLGVQYDPEGYIRKEGMRSDLTKDDYDKKGRKLTKSRRERQISGSRFFRKSRARKRREKEEEEKRKRADDAEDERQRGAGLQFYEWGGRSSSHDIEKIRAARRKAKEEAWEKRLEDATHHLEKMDKLEAEFRRSGDSPLGDGKSDIGKRRKDAGRKLRLLKRDRKEAGMKAAVEERSWAKARIRVGPVFPVANAVEWEMGIGAHKHILAQVAIASGTDVHILELSSYESGQTMGTDKLHKNGDEVTQSDANSFTDGNDSLTGRNSLASEALKICYKYGASLDMGATGSVSIGADRGVLASAGAKGHALGVTDLRFITEEKAIVICTCGGEIFSLHLPLLESLTHKHESGGGRSNAGQGPNSFLQTFQILASADPGDCRGGALMSAACFECNGVGGTAIAGITQNARRETVIMLSRGSLPHFAGLALSPVATCDESSSDDKDALLKVTNSELGQKEPLMEEDTHWLPPSVKQEVGVHGDDFSKVVSSWVREAHRLYELGTRNTGD